MLEFRLPPCARCGTPLTMEDRDRMCGHCRRVLVELNTLIRFDDRFKEGRGRVTAVGRPIIQPPREGASRMKRNR